MGKYEVCAALSEGDMVGKEGDVSGNRSMLTEGRQARWKGTSLAGAEGLPSEVRPDEADGQMGGFRVQTKEFRASVSPGADVLPFITSLTRVSPWDFGRMDQKGL